jgi:iduronate 2-sulfatase
VFAAPVDVYLVTGQSNMDGRGDARALPASARPPAGVRIFYVNPINKDGLHPSHATGWTNLVPGLAVPPNYRGSLPSPKFGPELSFARALADAGAARPLALIKVTQGGTSLRRDWNPEGGYMYVAFTNAVREALARLRAEGTEATLRGMIWHQGESDVGAGPAAYETNLAAFVATVRRDLGVPELPVVIGEIATNKSPEFRAVQRAVAERLPRAGFASADGLPTVEGTHFTTDSVVELGRRFAAGLPEAVRNAGRVAAACPPTPSRAALQRVSAREPSPPVPSPVTP